MLRKIDWLFLNFAFQGIRNCTLGSLICLVTQAINHCSSSSQCPMPNCLWSCNWHCNYVYVPHKTIVQKRNSLCIFCQSPLSCARHHVSYPTKSNNISIELNWTNSNSNFDVPVRLSLKTELSMWYAGVNDSYKQAWLPNSYPFWRMFLF